MRIIFFLFIIMPFISQAQVNRSANELAHENIKAYVISKLFKDQPYKPVSYSELKHDKDKSIGIAWSITHDFEIAETNGTTKSSTGAQQLYRFTFFLDKKLKVLRAENVQ